MNIFSTLPAGDSTAWRDDPVRLADGRMADSSTWALRYHLRGPSSLDVVAAADGTGWKSAISASASAALGAGAYAWTAVLTSGDERITVGSNQLTITPNVEAVSGTFDPRTAAQRALDACEAAMSTFNNTGGRVKKYTIAGREMEFQTIGDLLTLHSFWKARVLNETNAANIAQGLGNDRNLYVRFTRVR